MLLKPLITEKTVAESKHNRFVFLVQTSMTKTEVKVQVEKLFGVNVTKVQTITLRGKAYRTGKRFKYAYRPDGKKAIVTLKSGQRIELFDLKDSAPTEAEEAKNDNKQPEEKKTVKKTTKKV